MHAFAYLQLVLTHCSYPHTLTTLLASFTRKSQLFFAPVYLSIIVNTMENQKPQSAVSQIKNTNQEPEATTQQKTNMEEAPKHSDGQVTTDKNAEPDMDHTIQTKFLENTKQSQPQDDANTNTAPDDPERDGTEFNPEMLFGPAGGDPLNTGPKKKKKRSSKPKSKRGIVRINQPLRNVTKRAEQTYRLRRVLCRCSHHSRATYRGAGNLRCVRTLALD